MMITTCSILPAADGASFAASPAPVSTVAASPAASPAPASETPPSNALPEPGGEVSPDIEPSSPALSSSLLLPHATALASETPSTSAQTPFNRRMASRQARILLTEAIEFLLVEGHVRRKYSDGSWTPAP